VVPERETARSLGAGNRLIMADSNKRSGVRTVTGRHSDIFLCYDPGKDSEDIKTYLQAPKANQAHGNRTSTPAGPPGLLPDWNTYLARPCISSAGHVGGADSPVSLFRRNVNSKPKPLGPSVPVNLKGIRSKCLQSNYLKKTLF
jgi:hypothetical protein